MDHHFSNGRSPRILNSEVLLVTRMIWLYTLRLYVNTSLFNEVFTILQKVNLFTYLTQMAKNPTCTRLNVCKTFQNQSIQKMYNIFLASLVIITPSFATLLKFLNQVPNFFRKKPPSHLMQNKSIFLRLNLFLTIFVNYL